MLTDCCCRWKDKAWVRMFLDVALLPRGSSSSEVAVREIFSRIESVFAPRAAPFIRSEFKRHPWNVHRNWKLLDPKRVDSKASFAYLTEGKRNPSPLPSLHSYSNFKHLVTRVRINFDCSFQTTKPVQRSNRILFWIYLRSHFFSFESDIDSRHWWASTKMRSQAQKWRPWRLKGRQFGFRYIWKKAKLHFKP